MNIEKYDELLKTNIINLVRDHKETCNNENCGVSLFMVRELIEKTGIKLTDEDKALFI